ncbi:hypothetical protein L7F22_057365 [Adiantum nelumboides]|nr:hypothetical protein [Adiantum nelumboides]
MFHFQLVHVAGKKNVVVDALSRRPHVATVSIAYQHGWDEMRDHYSTDEDFAEPYDALVRGEHPDLYSLKDGFLIFREKLCVLDFFDRKVMTESHSPPYARLRGIDSTIKALEMYFFWPSLRKDTESFVRSCLICQRVKYDRGKAYGLLQPLSIPTAPWESIAMDFIFGLPKTSFENEGIWTIVDRFSKQAHFIPVRKQITVEQMAKTFLVTVFKYHGMPRSIVVSDRDFWRALWKNLHSTLWFSSSYHPQTDGQSEIVNSVGVHPCDKRQSVSTYRTLFPSMDFSEVEVDDDTLWKPDVRETSSELINRGTHFLEWLSRRKEREIAVVSHSGFLSHLLSIWGQNCSVSIQSKLRQGFNNCEMRSIVLVNQSELGAPIPEDYTGGIPSGPDAPSDAVPVDELPNGA